MSIYQDGKCFDQKYPESPPSPRCPMSVRIGYFAELGIHVIEAPPQIETDKAEQAYLEILSKIGPSREIPIDESRGSSRIDEPPGGTSPIDKSRGSSRVDEPPGGTNPIDESRGSSPIDEPNGDFLCSNFSFGRLKTRFCTIL